MFGQPLTSPAPQKATYSISELLPKFGNDKSAMAKALNVHRITIRKHAQLGNSSHVILKNGDKYELYVKTRLTGQSC